jgi:hypothetical protein
MKSPRKRRRVHPDLLKKERQLEAKEEEPLRTHLEERH